MVALFLAEGFEEIEAITPLDLLRRAGVDVTTFAVGTEKTVTGAHGIPVVCDEILEDLKGDFDLIILPGGMPGTKNLAASEKVKKIVLRQNERGKGIAAICAAPTVLGALGLLKNKKATCYPGMEPLLFAETVSLEKVAEDGNIVTSRGAGTAYHFALRLIARLKGEDTARQIAAGTVFDKVK